MEHRHLKVEIEQRVATVTVDRPTKLNALNAEVIAELGACFDALRDDKGVRAVVLTGAGEKAFVAGADIKELAALSGPEMQETSARGQQVFRSIERLGKPVIAAVNGFALGGGLELALACTFRTAATTARLGLPEITLGIIPGYAGTQRLPRLVGRGRALEMMLTGDPVSAEEAHRIGLVNHVFEPDTLLEKTLALAGKLAKRAPIAARMIMEVVDEGGERSLDEGSALEAELFGRISSTQDTKEGLEAFLEKRKAEFKGE